MPGDSLVIRAVEYRTAFYKVPTTQTESYSITLTLEESTEALAPIQVYPYSDEQSFKEAFLNIETQTEEIKAMKKNLDKGKLQDAARVTAQDSKSSTQQQLQMQSNQPITNSSLPTLNIFSPTAWRDFSKNLKQSKNEKDRKEKNYKK
jgi:beta-xylosidase